MNRLALRGLRARKARTAFTMLAVVLGVALIAGTFVLTDTIGKSFDKLVATTGENVDVKVAPKEDASFDDQAPLTIPASLEARVKGLPGVRGTSGSFENVSVAIIDAAGKKVGPTTGAPTLAYSARDERFDAFGYEGRQPRTAGEIALGRSAADAAGVKVGDRVRVQGDGPIRGYEVVGLATFGGTGATAGAGIAVVTLPQVQALAGEPGKLTELAVEADPGVSPASLRTRVAGVVGSAYAVRTGAQDRAKSAQDVKQILSYLTIGLLVFGLISLLVGSFVIFNTFTITVAQRTREFGMLRAIGASRRQVLRAVVLEALLIGVVGSVLGLFAGLGLAPLLQGLLGLVGFELPTTALVVAPRTVLVAVLVGTVVTLVACLAPALRATRVSPMAALRDVGATSPPSARRRRRVALEAAVAGLGVAVMLVGLLAGLATSPALILLGIGAVLVFMGVGLLSPLLVAPLAALIGRPLQAVGGVAGKIARGNAVRSPSRTAGTAAALMIGVALVAFVSIFVNGFKASFSGAFEKAVNADYVVVNDAGLIPEGAAGAAARVPGVADAVNLRVGQAKLGKATVSLAGLDPKRAASVVRVEWKDGSDARFRALAPDQAMVESDFAKQHRLRKGSTLRLVPRGHPPVTLRVAGTYADRGQLLGDATLADRTVRDAFGAKQVLAALIKVQPGPAGKGVQQRLDTALKAEFPTLEAQTRSDFIDSQVGQVNQILYLFYALLALSVLIALFGIVNTLALSVYERTRELGLLRAVGTSRRQIRRIVRGEAIITAVMGALLGVAIGVLFGVLISRPLAGEGFVLAIPVGTLLVLVVLGAAAGVLAAVAPARRASRVDVLRALTYE
jgi:putative ABC transport system permease protein